jgi:hypothetical protein
MRQLRLLSNNQSEVVKLFSEKQQGQQAMVSLGAVSKKTRTVAEQPVFFAEPGVGDSRSGAEQRRQPEPIRTEPQEEVRPEIKKFREAVRKAENSTLIFNLNLGRFPIMSAETMSTRTEKRPGSIPNEDTVATLDDILSVTDSVEFYGRKTKTYINNKDSKSGSYCTLPVRYEFRDKDTRFEAENFLRKKCGAHCSVPYPQFSGNVLSKSLKRLRRTSRSLRLKF